MTSLPSIDAAITLSMRHAISYADTPDDAARHITPPPSASAALPPLLFRFDALATPIIARHFHYAACLSEHVSRHIFTADIDTAGFADKIFSADATPISQATPLVLMRFVERYYDETFTFMTFDAEP